MNDDNSALLHVTRRDIIKALIHAGLVKGETIALHASLQSIGYVKGGAHTVIKAFLDVLGPRGTFMMPTHTYCMTPNPDQFHQESSPSKVGAISECLRSHPRAVRSFHPTHSVAAIGPHAEFLTRDALASSPCGMNNPFHRLEKCDGRILLLGTDHTSNTHLHTCEVLAKVPYLKIGWTVNRSYGISHIYLNGELVEKIYLFEIPGCSKGFQKIQPWLDKSNIIHHTRIGMAKTQLFKATELSSAVVPLLTKQPDLLLCDDPKCTICPRRRNYWERLARK